MNLSSHHSWFNLMQHHNSTVANVSTCCIICVCVCVLRCHIQCFLLSVLMLETHGLKKVQEHSRSTLTTVPYSLVQHTLDDVTDVW